MWENLKNLALVIFYIYATAYSIGFVVALFTNRKLIKEELKK